MAITRSAGRVGAPPSPISDMFEKRPWKAICHLANGAVLQDLRLHRIHLVAAGCWRSSGVRVPSELEQEESASLRVGLAAAFLLRRVRVAYDGRVVLMKGPEVGAFYPDAALRPYGDLDLLVDDASAAQRALLAAGFQPAGDERLYENIHHLRPLRWPGLPHIVEIHDRPKWIDSYPAPPKSELLEAAVPSRTAVRGIEALVPEHHAIVLAIHSWAHAPLCRIGHLLDVAAVTQVADRSGVDSIARAWGVQRVWRVTASATDSLFLGSRAPLPMRLWARNLRSVRERNVLESHLEHWLAPFWERSLSSAAVASATAVRRDLRPAEGEDWGVKVARARMAARAPFRGLSAHDEMLERRSLAGPDFFARLDAPDRDPRPESSSSAADEWKAPR